MNTVLSMNEMIGGQTTKWMGRKHNIKIKKASGGYFDEIRAQDQGIKVGQEAHQEG